MNSLLRVIPAVVVLASAGCISASSSWMADSAPTAVPDPTEARVIFYRPPNYWRNFEEWEVWDGERLAGIAENGGYFEVRCAPGRHLFFLMPGSEPAVDADLAGGRTYFVEVEMRMGLVAYPTLVPRGKGTPEEQRARDEQFGRCGCREPRQDRITEEKITPRREKARERAAESRGPRAGECLKLRPEDGE